MWLRRQWLESCGHWPRIAGSHQELDEARGTLPWSPGREHGPDTSALGLRTGSESTLLV